EIVFKAVLDRFDLTRFKRLRLDQEGVAAEAGVALPLHLPAVDAAALERFADAFLVGRLDQRDLDPGSRLEVDAEVELLGGEREAADHEDAAGEREEPATRPHEVEV